MGRTCEANEPSGAIMPVRQTGKDGSCKLQPFNVPAQLLSDQLNCAKYRVKAFRICQSYSSGQIEAGHTWAAF